MKQLTQVDRDSSLGCGVLSHRAQTTTTRLASVGFLLLIGAVGVGAGCSSDTNAGTGAGGSTASGGAAGSTSTGGSTPTGGSGGTGGDVDIDGSTDCSLRTDVDTYSANMAKQGMNKLMTFQLVKSDPAPPIKGNNDWKVKVTDSMGMPVTKDLAVRVWMPEHKHDALLLPTITYDAASSTFDLNPISPSLMGGMWQMLLSITDANDTTVTIDSAAFNFCIQ